MEEKKGKVPGWLAIILLIFCWPLGIVFIWLTNWKTVAKTITTIVYLGLVVIGLAVLGMSTFSNAEKVDSESVNATSSYSSNQEENSLNKLKPKSNIKNKDSTADKAEDSANWSDDEADIKADTDKESNRNNEADKSVAKAGNSKYMTAAINDMYTMLDADESKAIEHYTGMHVKVVGYLGDINTDYNSFYLGVDDSIFPDDINCTFTDEEQLKFANSKSAGDLIAVYGKITSVGGIWEYELGVDKIEDADPNAKIYTGIDGRGNKTDLGFTIKERAALSNVQSYIEFSDLSKQGMIDQLLFDGYTEAEAAYALDNCDVDWNEMAAKSGAGYLKDGILNKDELFGQLIFEGFTEEQAAYAVEHN